MRDALLASKMYKWAQKKREMDALEKEIKAEVLSRGETVKRDSCTATYNSGRTTYDNETTVLEANIPADVIAQYETTTVDWAAIVRDSDDIKPEDRIVAKKSPPSVTLKL